MEVASYSSIVVSALMKKIPEAVLLNMTHRPRNHKEWGMINMLNAFCKELEIREQHASIFSHKESRGNQSATPKESSEFKPRPAGKTPLTASALFAKEDGGTVRMKNFVFCKEEHDEMHCSKVSNKEERKKLVLRLDVV